MHNLSKKIHKILRNQFEDLVEKIKPSEDIDLKHTIQLKRCKVRISNPIPPLQILLSGEESGKCLFLYPEIKFAPSGKFITTDTYLLLDPEQFFSHISGFIRFFPGDSIILGRDNRMQNLLLQYPETVAKQHLRLKFTGNNLVIKDKSIEKKTCITPLISNNEINSLEQLRHKNLAHFIKVFPGKLETLPTDNALELLERVIEKLEHDPCQQHDSTGQPGGVVQLPKGMDAIIVGDLHARIDNLLLILTQNHFLKALEDGNMALIILGDAVHFDEEGKEHEMNSSILMMDFIFHLKLKFPKQVYYIRGNHDSFSEDLSKNGVLQGLHWKKALLKKRGNNYLEAMIQFYKKLPYIVLSDKFLTCHAGAPTSKVSMKKLVEIKQNPKLEREITSIRLQESNRLSGYTRADVKRLRTRLNLSTEIPFIVGHTPLSDDHTFWWNVNEIPNHHILFSAHPLWVGVIVQIQEQFFPLQYATEPLLDIINQQTDSMPTS